MFALGDELFDSENIRRIRSALYLSELNLFTLLAHPFELSIQIRFEQAKHLLNE